MALIDTELGKALTTPVKRKANTTGQLHASPGGTRAQAKRVASGTPEVMVKVTGFAKGAGHVKAHLDYISRHGKVDLENDRGERFQGRDEVIAFFKDWQSDFGECRRHKQQRDTMQLVLSMPEGTDPQAVQQAVRAFAQSTFGHNHEYVFALHTDEPHPHAHVTVKCRGFDGRMLQVAKGDPHIWRQTFAERLRAIGIAAEATPRRARGVVQKAQPSVIRHIERGDNTHPPRVPRVIAAQVKGAAQEMTQGDAASCAMKPWEEATYVRQCKVRNAWLMAADALQGERPRLTFEQKDIRNERPDYDGISIERARAGQWAAALYQSDVGRTGSAAPATAFAGVRDVPGSHVVRVRRPAAMLLHPHASDRVGRDAGADFKMRRTRAGAARTAGEHQPVMPIHSATAENNLLANQIRAFVAAMPAMETQAQQLKRQLRQQFATTIDQARDRRASVTPPSEPTQKIEADRAAPKEINKDIHKDLDR
jgi:type IV secretory pathway VirD2 relaxase